MKQKLIASLPYLGFLTALSSTVISLGFSEIAHIPPCTLCWYQRIAMYPLVAIFAVGILRKDRGLSIYVLPISIAGLLVALYHNLIYFKIIPEVITTCINGISCTSREQTLAGFVTIPLLSFLAFALITASMVLYSHFSKDQVKNLKS